MTKEARKRLITWGVDGYGVRWFICHLCLEEFGSEKEIDYDNVNHECKEVNNGL